jgi:hypothetical protein
MTDDLSTLPLEVAEAVEYVDSVFSDADNGEWACVRAELLRLYAENMQLKKDIAFANERIEAMELSTEELETELAAPRARIAGAPHVEVTLGGAIDAEIPPDLALRKLALVKLEDGE